MAMIFFFQGFSTAKVKQVALLVYTTSYPPSFAWG